MREPRLSRAVPVVAAALILFGPGATARAQTSGESSKLVLAVRGAQLGTEEATVKRTPEGWQIAGTAQFGPPLDLTTRRLLVRYDESWHPIELDINAVAHGAPLSIHTTFGGTSATSEIVRLGQPSTKTDQVSPDAIVLPNLFFGTYEALAMRLAAMTGDSATFPAYVAPEAEIQIDARRLDTQIIQTAEGRVEARRYALTFRNPRAPLPAELWTDPRGRLLRFEVPSQSLVLMRDDIASVSARRETISRPGDERVTIPANGFNLAGTVSTPAGAPDAKGRYAAVLLIPGSGPLDRDEVVAGIPIFGQIAGELADGGYLVLRYDKRGIGQSGGRPETASLQDYAEDALSAVRYLEKRKDVDPDRIALFGHSEGGWVALLAAARNGDVAALVLAAVPSSSGADLVLEQQRHALDTMKLTDAEKKARVDLQKRIQAAVLGSGPWNDIPANLRAQADTEWFRSLLAFTPAAVVPKVRQPILILQGALDTQVPPAHADALAALARARKKIPADAVAVVKIPGVNHLFVPATTGEVSEYPNLTGKAVSPEVAKETIGFLKKVLKGT